MKANETEKELLKEVREASPEDCKTVIAALYALEGREDPDGGEDDTLTPLGHLVGAIAGDLMVNGILKMKYEAEAYTEI